MQKQKNQSPQKLQSKASDSKPSKPQRDKLKSQKKAPKLQWHAQAKVSCVCGNSFVTGSTLPEIYLDICNVCHPFYTGKQKLVDVEGRVERFQKRYAQFNKQQQKKQQK